MRPEGARVDLTDYGRLLRRNWFILAVGALLGLLVGLLYAGQQTPVFEAQASVVVSTGQSSDVSDLNAGNTFASQAVKTYATVATSPLVLNPVISKLNLDTTPGALQSAITTSIPLDTTVLSIAVQDPSAQRAADIANAVSDSLKAAVAQISPATSRSADVTVTRIQPATVPGSPISPKVALDAALGLLVGLVLGFGVVALREALGVRVRDERDLAGLTDRPVIGSILFDRTLRTSPLLFTSDPQSAAAESFRSLRTALHFLEFDGRVPSFVITSSVESEGKSISAANLATAMGSAGQDVVVVDADLRRPKLGRHFGIDSSLGLSDVLVGDAELDDVLHLHADGHTVVLPAGQVPPNPTELLQSKAMVRLIQELERRYSAVVIDGPPLLPVSDAGILAKLTGGAVVVASAAKVTQPQLRRALRGLDAIGAHVVGIVLTMVPGSRSDTYGYASSRRRWGRRRPPIAGAQ
jgi:capsular exopolysaccharide synthesis family protein